MSEEINNRKFIQNRVSIVTPVFNGSDYINKLLNSVLNQTWDDIEMIISDDGSTDNTIEVCESYRNRFNDKGYSFSIITGEHINASGAVGRGLKAVTGEYLIWPDGDDELLPDSVKNRVTFLQNNPTYQCVRSLQEYVNYESGEPVKPLERTGSLETGKLFWDILYGNTFVCCGCYMLRSKPFFEIYPTGLIPIYNVGQNFQMLLPFMYKYECPTLQEVLYRVNRRDDSHSARTLTKEQFIEKYSAYEQLIDEIALICAISSPSELKKIDAWKAKRRLELAYRFDDKKLEINALISLFKDGEINFLKLLKGFARVIKHIIIPKKNR